MPRIAAVTLIGLVCAHLLAAGPNLGAQEKPSLRVAALSRRDASASADTAANRSYRDSLTMVRSLVKQGRYASGEASARRLLASVESAVPIDSLRLATALDELVESMWRGGK